MLDEEEFEFTLSDGFDISPNDCRVAYRIFSEVKLLLEEEEQRISAADGMTISIE